MENQKNYTFAEVAAECGISEKELVELALKEGLIDENGMPTQKALDNGLLEVETSIINTEKGFNNMSFSEIEEFEKDTNSIVLFSEDTGICFQKAVSNDNSNTLAIMVSDFEDPILIFDKQIEYLKDYLNRNF